MGKQNSRCSFSRSLARVCELHVRQLNPSTLCRWVCVCEIYLCERRARVCWLERAARGLNQHSDGHAAVKSRFFALFPPSACTSSSNNTPPMRVLINCVLLLPPIFVHRLAHVFLAFFVYTPFANKLLFLLLRETFNLCSTCKIL
jgi:hypothetical protein